MFKKQCSRLMSSLFSESSEGPINFDVRLFEAKNRVFEFDHLQMNMFVRCSNNDIRIRLMFDKMVRPITIVFSNTFLMGPKLLSFSDTFIYFCKLNTLCYFILGI